MLLKCTATCLLALSLFSSLCGAQWPFGKPHGKPSSATQQTMQTHGAPLNWEFPAEPEPETPRLPDNFEIRHPVPMATVAVECRENIVHVEVKKDMFGIGQFINPSFLTLGTCAVSAEDNAAQVLLFEYDLHNCGSDLMMTDDSFIYGYRLNYDPQQYSDSPVVRTSKAAVIVECHYPRKQNVSSLALEPHWVPFSAVKVSEEFLYFSLKLMTDDWMYERPSYQYYLGDVLHIEATVMQYFHAPLRVYVDSCVATLASDMNSSPRYVFIDNHGCFIDARLTGSSSEFLQRPAENKLRFRLEAFRFQGVESGQMYITCRLRATSTAHAIHEQHRACSYQGNMWREVSGYDSECASCESGSADTGPGTGHGGSQWSGTGGGHLSGGQSWTQGNAGGGQASVGGSTVGTGQGGTGGGQWPSGQSWTQGNAGVGQSSVGGSTVGTGQGGTGVGQWPSGQSWTQGNAGGGQSSVGGSTVGTGQEGGQSSRGSSTSGSRTGGGQWPSSQGPWAQSGKGSGAGGAQSTGGGASSATIQGGAGGGQWSGGQSWTQGITGGGQSPGSGYTGGKGGSSGSEAGGGQSSGGGSAGGSQIGGGQVSGSQRQWAQSGKGSGAGGVHSTGVYTAGGTVHGGSSASGTGDGKGSGTGRTASAQYYGGQWSQAQGGSEKVDGTWVWMPGESDQSGGGSTGGSGSVQGSESYSTTYYVATEGGSKPGSTQQWPKTGSWNAHVGSSTRIHRKGRDVSKITTNDFEWVGEVTLGPFVINEKKDTKK